MPTLFDAYTFGDKMTVKNRIVMPPITRTRASEGDVLNELMATYYGQRASAGLIVAEATAVAPSSRGYALSPDIYTEAQRQGWRLVTDEVHRMAARYFCKYFTSAEWRIRPWCQTVMPPWGVTEQRAEHSDVFAHGSDGRLRYMRAGAPRRLSTDEISSLVDTFSQAFVSARQASFDGAEIHQATAIWSTSL